jgi:hypothetical protein
MKEDSGAEGYKEKGRLNRPAFLIFKKIIYYS